MFSIPTAFRCGVAAARTVSALVFLFLAIEPAFAIQPVTLTCEYMHNPVGIDSLRPRLAWMCKSGPAERGVRQIAYRILVASSREKLDSGNGDLWDTRRVDTDRSVNIDYRGKPLTSGIRCWWKAMIWDAAGSPSGWSAPASWSMGLLKASDWQARWITVPREMQPKGVEGPLLRKGFVLDKPLRRAVVYVSGLGLYELHLNGKKVGDHELDPGFTAYDKRALYATYDITESLRTGKNALGVMLGNGWYNYAVPAAWDFDKAPWRDRPKLLLQLAIEFSDGTTQTILSDSSWRVNIGPLVDNEIMTGETYDARKEIHGWDEAEFAVSGWTSAAEAAPPAGVLSAESYPAVRTFQTIRPVGLTEPKPGVYVYDFGQNMAGLEELTVQGKAGDTVKMQFGEELHADGTLSQDNIKSLTHEDGFQTDIYTLKGSGGDETYRPRFTYHGFRYAQVTGFPGKPSLANLRALVLHAGFDAAGTFECSNPLLNKIQAATQWAYISNFEGMPTDCPTREKNGWMGDAQLAAETGLFNYSGGPNYAKWIRDMMDAQRPSGELPGIVPTGGWGFAWGNGPAWDSAYLLIPWDLFQFNGDRHILEEQYAGLKRYVDYVDAKSPNHIANFGLGDWAPFKTETPADLTSTGYFYRDTLLVSQIAGLLNRRPDESKYRTLAAAIREAFNSTYYHAATGLYGDGSQTALGCALYQGLAPDNDRKRILANLASNIEAHGNHLDTGILGAKYVMQSLSEGGMQELAYTLATQNTLPSWGYWLEHGATTLLEQWSGQPLGDFSRNHIMFGDISAWCYETLGGINPDPGFPGFKRTIIRPQMSGDLTWARASHRTLFGDVVCDWKRTGDNLTIDVTVPANTSATVFVPAKQISEVMETGKPAASATGVQFVRVDGDRAVFRVESGTYQFTTSQNGKLAARPPADFKAWGEQTLDQIQTDFYIPDRKLYADEWKRDATNNNHNPAFMWGCGVMLPALIAASRVDPQHYTEQMRSYIKALDIYWTAGSNPAYDVLPGPKSPDRYYDDNGWVCIALVDAYDITHNKQYLDRAEATYKFILSGEDDKLGGGIYWHEQDKKSKNTCSNAPAIVAALRLYQATQSPNYLVDAKRLYLWTNAHLQDADGLYWDNIRLDGKVEQRKWTYNTALMIRANVLLHAISRDTKYLQEAERVAKASEAHWVKPDTGAIADGGAFAHLLSEAFLAVYSEDADEHWSAVVVRALTFVHENVRDPDGRYASPWDQHVTAKQDKVGLLTQASVARAYLMAASVLVHR